MSRLVGGGGSLKLIRTVTKTWPEEEWPTGKNGPEEEWPTGKNGPEVAAQTTWKCG